MFITLTDPCYNERLAEPEIVTGDYEDTAGMFPTKAKNHTGIIPFQHFWRIVAHFFLLQDKLNHQPEWKARDDVLATSAIQIQTLMK